MDVLKSLTQSYHHAIEQDNLELKLNIQLKIAQYYYNIEDFESSKNHLKQILNLQPSYSNVNYYLGLISLNLGNEDEGIKYFKKELKLNPDHEYAKDIIKKYEINSNFPIITILVSFITFAIFFLTQTNYETILKFAVSKFNLNIFSLYSSVFFHANIYHLLLNNLFLLMFGTYLEKYIGSLKTLLIFLTGGILGNLFQTLVSIEGFTIGMSAAIFAIFGAIVAREPLLEYRLFGILKVPLILLYGIVFILQNMISLYVQNQTQNFMFGEIAHLFGFLFGMLIMVFYDIDLVFFFYNWLAISAGYFLLAYAMSNLFLNILYSSIFQVFFNIGQLSFAILIITYAYYKIKLDVHIDKKAQSGRLNN